MVYFALQTVPFDGNVLACQTPTSSSTYTLVLKQGSGSQLSYEEQGLPAIYAVFWIFMGATMALHIYGHMVGPKPSNYPKERPRLVDALVALLALHAFSNTLHLIEWGVVDQTGKDSGLFLAAVGGLFRLAALCALWVMAAFIATGYGISTMNIGSMRDPKNYRGAILLTVLVVLGFTTTLLYSLTPRSVASARGSSAQGGMAITLTLFILGYLVWFVRRVRETIAAEVSVTKKALLNSLMWVTLGSFFILPFAEILSFSVPTYEALRVAVGLDMFLTQTSAALFVWLLWPSRSAEAFHTVDSSLLGSDGLDEAYNYAATLEDGSVKQSI